MNLPGQAPAAAGPIALYVITTKTKDHGDKFVVRRHHWNGPQHFAELTPVALSDTLEDARKAMHAAAGRGIVCLPRQHRDDPVIVESWGAPLVVTYLQHKGKTL